jgi:hypothetical protein
MRRCCADRRRRERVRAVTPKFFIFRTAGNFSVARQDRQSRAASAKFAHEHAQMITNAIYLMQILASAFLAILFLQSGIDKVVDRAGNLEWLRGHFAKSPLAGFVPALFAVLTVLEIAAGTLSGIGCLLLLAWRNPTIAFYGALLSALAILALFFGQRMVKEYAGAAILVPYFLLALAAIYLLSQ